MKNCTACGAIITEEAIAKYDYYCDVCEGKFCSEECGLLRIAVRKIVVEFMVVGYVGRKNEPK